MVRSANPFTPTFGASPFALAGRTELVDDVIGGLANRPGDPNRSTIFTGPRGSGKTVLLNTIASAALGMGWVAASAFAREGLLAELVADMHTRASHVLSPATETAITAIQVGPFAVERTAPPSIRSWREVFSTMVKDLNGAGIGALFIVDEVDAQCEELITLVEIYQHFVGERRDVALLLAGLPGKVSALLTHDNVSFVRRAFQRSLDSIPLAEVEAAMLDTIQENGRDIDRDALEEAARASQGFAFAIQLVGYYLWRDGRAKGNFTKEDVVLAIQGARREMERSVFVPTLRELAPREVEYLYAMASDSGPSSTSEIAHRMGIGMTHASNIRRRLIEHGVIAEVRMGQVAFEMPLLQDYLRDCPPV